MKGVIFFYLLLFYSVCYAQEYSYRHYTVHDGLPQMQITYLFQDSWDFIWVGTRGGVSRFDGMEFENFDIEDGLASGFITHISEGPDGAIYILCDNGLSVYDNGKIKSFPFPRGIRAYIPFSFVAHDADGNIWVAATWMNNWNFMNFTNGVYSDAYRKIHLPDTTKIISMFYDKLDSSMVVGTKNNGIYIIRRDCTRNILPSLHFIKVKHKNRDKLLFEGNKQGDHIKNLFECSLSKPDNYTLIMDSVGMATLYISDNHYLISSFREYRFNEYDNGRIIRHKKKFQWQSATLCDKEKNIWIGTEVGLYRLQSKAFLNFTAESGINNYVWSIVEDKYGNMLFSSFLDGLSVYDGKSFTKYGKYYFGGVFYRGAIRNQYGEVLLPFSKGIIKYDGKNFSDFEGIPKSAMLFIFEDTTKNRLLISSAFHGLIIKEDNGSTKIFNISPGNKKEYISTINKDKFGRYWLGGLYGVTILEGDSLMKLPTEKLPYSRGAISSYRDSRDNLWLGARSGLYFYDYKTFRKIDSARISGPVKSLAGMAGDKLFVGMIKGIAILDLDKFYGGKEDILFFDRSNGFLGMECEHNTAYTDSKGYTWVSAYDRVIKIDPRQIRKNPSKPRIYIKSALARSKESKSYEEISSYGTVLLKWYQKDIKFNFHAVTFTAPERIKYKYRLLGYDEEWSTPTKERNAVYTNLRYGDYKFQVKACNGDGAWNSNTASFAFTIVPAFWQTNLFFIGANIFIAGIFFYGFMYYQKRKRRGKEEKDKIERHFTELQLKTLKNQMDPHFTYNAINSLGNLIYTEQKKEAYDYLVNFSRLIRKTIDGSEEVFRTLGEELDFTRNYLELQMYRYKDKLNYEINLSPEVSLERRIPRMVIQTHVENALKHGLIQLDENGKVVIDIRNEESTLIIEITDNGVGRKKAGAFNEDSTGLGIKMTERYFELINKSNKEKISQEIIDLYNNTGKPSGTKVVIRIPAGISFDF